MPVIIKKLSYPRRGSKLEFDLDGTWVKAEVIDEAGMVMYATPTGTLKTGFVTGNTVRLAATSIKCKIKE